MDLLNYRIETFGCKVNTYDTGLLQQRLAREGFTLESQTPRVFVLNTCAVTAEATKDAVRRIRKIKAENPNSLVVVTGCAAQVDTDQFAALKGADLIVANSHKGRLGEIVRDYYSGKSSERVFKSNIFKKEDLEGGGGLEEGHTRAFVKIQDGCDSFCTFCVIPFARGKSRSLSIDELVRRVNELHAQGYNEMVLTGVHIGDYRDEALVDGGLEALVETLLSRTRVERFRLSSLEPIEVTPRLLKTYADSRMCAHFHMSIQSANTKVLSDMKRKYGHAEVESGLLAIAETVPNAFVGMDVIAGFPGESDEEFIDSLERLRRLPWTRLHVFPYSQRPGTFAARRTDQVPGQVIASRAKALRELSQERYAEHALKQIGAVKRVLLLKKKSDHAQGLSRDYWPIQLADFGTVIKNEVQVRITGYDQSQQSRAEGVLVGELVKASASL